MYLLQKLQQRYGSGEARALYEIIMQHRFNLSRTDILLGKDTTLSADEQAELQIIVERVAKGEPVQYVLGSEEFCGREFLVAPGVLIPRPETQQLVHLVEQHLAPGSTVLDVGTGSGCIAVTLALAGYQVTALDMSEEALAIARQNADRLGAQVEFVRGDILAPSLPFVASSPIAPLLTGNCPLLGSALEAKGFPARTLPQRGSRRGLCCIVSNPPYICESEAAGMDVNVLDYEPHLALFVPDDDPLLFYRAIADYGLTHLAEGGQIFFEANRAYCSQVAELLLQKYYKDVRIVNDQYDNERFVFGSRRAAL